MYFSSREGVYRKEEKTFSTRPLYLGASILAAKRVALKSNSSMMSRHRILRSPGWAKGSGNWVTINNDSESGSLLYSQIRSKHLAISSKCRTQAIRKAKVGPTNSSSTTSTSKTVHLVRGAIKINSYRPTFSTWHDSILLTKPQTNSAHSARKTSSRTLMWRPVSWTVMKMKMMKMSAIKIRSSRAAPAASRQTKSNKTNSTSCFHLKTSINSIYGVSNNEWLTGMSIWTKS